MTSSIPDGISFGDLEALRENAPAEVEPVEKTDEPKFDGKTQQEVVDIAQHCVQDAIDQCNDPMVHKVMLFEIIENFIRWHTEAGITQDDDRSKICWLRDAGKFQAMANILSCVSVGPDDFTME